MQTLFAGKGLTAASAVLNVIGGDGITSNNDEIEATVDDTTIELSATDGSGTIRAKTSSVSKWRNSISYRRPKFTILVTGLGYITATLTQEQVEDFAGAVVASGGTKTGITVTYQDSSGDMDFVVSDTTVAGDSGSTGMTPGDTLTIAGGTNATTAMSGDTLTVNVDDAFLKNDADDTTTGAITIDKTTSTTNAVTDVLTLQSQSSGTPANNIGVGMAFGIETGAGNVETGARIAAIATDVDSTNEDI